MRWAPPERIGRFLRKARRVCLGQLGREPALPMAIAQLNNLRIGAEVFCIESERGTDQPHRLDGAPKRARHEIEIGESRHQRLQHVAVALRLGTACCVERNIALALVAGVPVPVCFPMTDKIQRDPGLQKRRAHRLAFQLSSLFTTEMSGASSFFMPWTW